MQRERHQKFRESEGRARTTPEGGDKPSDPKPTLDTSGSAADLPAADSVTAPAASSGDTKRTPVVLTPAAQARGNSFLPHYKARPRNHKAKEAKKAGADDPLLRGLARHSP